MSLPFSIYLAVHYFGRNFCDIVHTANQLLHSANLQIFRSVPPCMHHIKFSKKYMMWYVYPLWTSLGWGIFTIVTKHSIDFHIDSCIKANKISKGILKSFKSFKVESYLAFYVAFTYIKTSLLFLEVWLIFFLPTFSFLWIFITQIENFKPKIHYFDILQLHMHILSYSTHACVSVPLSCDMVSLYWFCFQSKQNWEP